LKLGVFKEPAWKFHMPPKQQGKILFQVPGIISKTSGRKIIQLPSLA
jgi:hypothetical protein